MNAAAITKSVRQGYFTRLGLCIANLCREGVLMEPKLEAPLPPTAVEIAMQKTALPEFDNPPFRVGDRIRRTQADLRNDPKNACAVSPCGEVVGVQLRSFANTPPKWFVASTCFALGDGSHDECWMNADRFELDATAPDVTAPDVAPMWKHEHEQFLTCCKRAGYDNPKSADITTYTGWTVRGRSVLRGSKSEIKVSLDYATQCLGPLWGVDFTAAAASCRQMGYQKLSLFHIRQTEIRKPKKK